MIKTINLIKNYKIGTQRINVLQGVDLEVEKGAIVGIVGPSGAGKTTLLNLLGGLDEPTKGRVELEGRDISRLSDRQRAQIRNREFGFVFQFYHLLAEFTALENVMIPAIIKNEVSSQKIREQAANVLARCGLSQRLNHKPAELSGGERQRVAIARAIINKPKIIFCDEPTGNLDTQTGLQIKDLLWNLNVEYNATLIIATHALELVKDAKRIIHLKDGKILS